jgi:hypothetical protein
MRAVLGFCSMLAMGLMIAAVLVTGAPGVFNGPLRPLTGTEASVDYLSVAIGLGIGIVIAVLAQIDWSELSHRLAQWLLAHAQRLGLIGLGATFVAVIVYF